MPPGLPEPNDVRHSPDTGHASHDSARRGGSLSNLTFSIGRLILKCKVEIERVNDAGPGSSEAPARPLLGNWSRRARRRRTSGNPQEHPADLPIGFYQSRDVRSYPEGITVPRPRDPAPVVFWEGLDPTEREAFRSVAFPRTFAAGARLIQEGDQADHVIVILSGRVRICVEENGTERLLAERGPGQLVGERGALQVSMRSASVIAVETVRALVVRTGDFAVFISDHPAVLDLVERQLYDRLTEDPARYGPDVFRGTAADGAWSARQLRARKHPQGLNGENCTVILSDVVGFGARTRTDEDRRLIREALLSMTHAVLRDIPDVWSWDDRGDGLLTVVPPNVPTAMVMARLHRELPAALAGHNRACHPSAVIQLRVAINVGPVTTDTVGLSGEAIIIAARLVEAPLLKKAISQSGASLGVIASAFIYETVIRHRPGLTGYSQVQVSVKELSIPAWMVLIAPAGAPAASGFA